MNTLIRPMIMSELEESLALVWSVFLEFEGPEYSDEGIKEFQAFISIENINLMLCENKIKIFVCVEDDKIVGVIATRPPCHINLLFVDKKFHRQGIARALFNRVLENYADLPAGSEMTVNSSPYALKVYRRLGFAETDIEQTVNGMRFIPMKYIFK